MTARFSLDTLPVDENREILLATDALPAAGAAVESSPPDIGGGMEYSPSAIYVPEEYEPNYAYPLLIWLHDEGGSERDLLRIMPQVSLRNYFGLSMRGPLEARDSRLGFRWSQQYDDAEVLEKELYFGVRHLRRTYHIHSERVFVGGCGEGATLALQLVLRRPEWFAGAVSVGGRFPEMQRPLAKFRMLQGKRTMLASGAVAAEADRQRTRNLSRLLHTAGMTVCPRFYNGSDQLHQDVFRDIDRWMMRECYRAVAVDY